MPYRFALDDNLQNGFRRIASEQFDLASSAIAQDTNERGVHECRKALKRLRALVRLLSEGLGPRRAKKRHKSLGAIARLFSEHRDLEVIAQTLSHLHETAESETAQAIAILRLRATNAGTAGPHVSDCSNRVRAHLVKEAGKFASLTLQRDASDVLRSGLEKSYRSARQALREVRESPDAERYHDLRKAVQLHWRQMNLLARAWPAEFSARASAARDISQMLGDERDLELVARHAAKSTDLSIEQRDLVVKLCLARQEALSISAKALAERLFVETTRAYTRRAMAYWDGARSSVEKTACNGDSRVAANGEFGSSPQKEEASGAEPPGKRGKKRARSQVSEQLAGG